ncbi:bone morphogenetic protein 1-like isoform X1 [Ptychodera flava]|uniref:bone morphogenetic protein 1-like isoform X1 n=1 Tax=Ptychodera flava TaxID=63121 RepID=UPI003969DBCF
MMKLATAVCLVTLINLLRAVIAGKDGEICPTQPCENNGRCVQNGTSYECVCAPGFIGKYCHDVECNERKNITKMTDVKSPFYPKDYPIYKICEYSYIAGTGQLIMLNLSDFELEMSEECKKDYLTVFDGSDETGPPLGKYCGNKTQGSITTTGRRIFLKFRSDGSNVAKGFHLTVTPIQDDGTPLSTRTDYTVREDDETKARGGKLSSHRAYPNGSELVKEKYEIDIRNDGVYDQT